MNLTSAGATQRSGNLHTAFLFCLVVLWFSNQALAFPSNTRLGYASCSSCHVSPTGGGVLVPYGRMSAADILSTWSYETEAQFGHGIFKEDMDKPKRFLIGGDLRQVRFQHDDVYRKIDMQRDLELAVIAGPVTIVGLVGKYPTAAGKEEMQTRRHYALVGVNQNISVRAGKFFPAYGILHEDHTIATRKGLGWDQGKESLNAEVSYKNERGEVFVTRTFGNVPSVFKFNDGKTVGRELGLALRGAYYLGKSSQVGASYFQGENKETGFKHNLYGMYAMIGVTKWAYALLEVDREKTMGAKAKTVGYQLLGVEPIKGVHLQGFYHMGALENTQGFKLQWFPRPHWELLAAYEIAKKTNTASGLLHYYF